MAEFSEVMRQYYRMCDGHSCTSSCPMKDDTTQFCETMGQIVTDKGAEKVERIILDWAEEHPEPVYPTWKNYFASLYGQNYGLYGDKQLSISRLCDEQVPPEIAQKLGLEPKYG